jgi:hypothetical protein
VAQVAGDDLEAQLQSRNSDRKILEIQRDALSRLLALDPPDHAGNLDRNRIHREVAAQPIDKG